MGNLVSEMSTLISEKFVDVFDHIRNLEGRPDFKEADYTHQIMMQLNHLHNIHIPHLTLLSVVVLYVYQYSSFAIIVLGNKISNKEKRMTIFMFSPS